jgi:hypothetical protein
MAEKTIVVCDVCGKPAAEVVTIKTSRGNFVKDLCAQHVTELTSGARKPRPGRPRKMGEGSTATPRRRGRPRKTSAAGRSTRKATGRKTTRRKATRRKATQRKAQASTSS